VLASKGVRKQEVSMTRILLTGAGGMLGHDLHSILHEYDLTATTRADLDITDQDAVDRAVADCDVVINAAAYTRVDQAETEPEEALRINAEGPATLARACATHQARLIHVSTDYVFDGSATTPYPEDTARNPQSVYGRTKAAGEEALEEIYPEGSLIIRTAWLYGTHGKHFPGTMLELSKTHDTLSVVTDQVGQPTWSRDLARMIKRLVDSDIHSGVLERIQPTTSDAFVRPAPRPAWSVLGHDAWGVAGLETPRPWQDALAEAFPTVCPDFSHPDGPGAPGSADPTGVAP
jgi:dTDP-4-dehydrorhamnose reductase